MNPNSTNEQELHQMKERYGDDIYHAFYSLNDLRPYSIIQFDKTIDAYNNTWIEPDSLIQLLSPDQREALMGKVVYYLNTLPEKDSKSILCKIDNWCIANRQLKFILCTMRIPEEKVLSACMKIDIFNQGLNFISKRDSLSLNNISHKEVNQGLNEITNTLSGLNPTKQLHYYSRIYSELYTIASTGDRNK